MTFDTWVERVEQHEASPAVRAVLLDWAEDRNALLREILRLHDALQTAWWAPRTDPGSTPPPLEPSAPAGNAADFLPRGLPCPPRL